MLELLAQLVSPPLQNSPVRLPGPDASEQRPRTDREPLLQVEPTEQPDKATPQVTLPSQPTALPTNSSLPIIRGSQRYSSKELRLILGDCLLGGDLMQRMANCAKRLSARLSVDGFINSVVVVRGVGTAAYLEVVDGRLAEVRVNSSDSRLQRRIARLVRSLEGKVLNLYDLQEDLVLLKRVHGVGTIKAELSSLGADPATAVLTVAVSPGSQPWQGELSLRNDGSSGSGEYRATGAFLKGDVVYGGDSLLLYGETSWTGDPTIGQLVGSIGYTIPLSDLLSLTGSFGYTRNEAPELDNVDIDIGSSQYQGLGQFDYVFSESLRHRWSAFAGVSFNRNINNLRPVEASRISLSQDVAYLRLGVSGNGVDGPLTWFNNAYLLQALSSDYVDAGSAAAVGGLLSGNWAFAPNWQVGGRLGGQLALDRLPTSMYFSVGSDVGIRGLPGQFISGESGWLGTVELTWSFWRNQNNTLQLLPFIGAGGIKTDLGKASFGDTVGATGLLARWLAGQSWTVEMGYVHQFSTDNNLGAWNDWILDDGFYAKVLYRF